MKLNLLLDDTSPWAGYKACNRVTTINKAALKLQGELMDLPNYDLTVSIKNTSDLNHKAGVTKFFVDYTDDHKLVRGRLVLTQTLSKRNGELYNVATPQELITQTDDGFDVNAVLYKLVTSDDMYASFVGEVRNAFGAELEKRPRGPNDTFVTRIYPPFKVETKMVHNQADIVYVEFELTKRGLLVKIMDVNSDEHVTEVSTVAGAYEPLLKFIAAADEAR